MTEVLREMTTSNVPTRTPDLQFATASYFATTSVSAIACKYMGRAHMHLHASK